MSVPIGPIMGTTRHSARQARRRVRSSAWVAVVALAASVAVVSSAPAGAQQAPTAPPTPDELIQIQKAQEATLQLEPPAPPSPDDPFLAVTKTNQEATDAAVVRFGAVQASDAADADMFVAATKLNDAIEKDRIATERRNAARTKLAQERDRLSDLTIRAYVTGSEQGLDQYKALVKGDTTNPAAGRKVLFEQVLGRQEDVTNTARKDLIAARKALVDADNHLVVAQIESDARKQVAADRAADEAKAIAAHEKALAAQANARARLSNAPLGGLVPEGASLIGMPRLNAEDLAGWFRSTTYSPRVSTPIEDYAKWFIDEGNAEGMRGDIAFAQAVLETGGFANNDTLLANNFSGIGHCDTCASGWKFPSPEMGVRAQIQLLKTYAVRKPVFAHDLVNAHLHGPAGCCPTWGDLTTVWATDPTYAPKVMLIYSGIVDYALSRRHAGQGFDSPSAAILPTP